MGLSRHRSFGSREDRGDLVLADDDRQSAATPIGHVDDLGDKRLARFGEDQGFFGVMYAAELEALLTDHGVAAVGH